MVTNSETDVVKVLKDDGLKDIDWATLEKYQNATTTNLDDLRDEFGRWTSWAVRIAYNDFFGSVLINQLSGEGNRKHYHPDADENWVILDGEWEWWIEGQGTKKVFQNDIIVVPKGVPHLITCVKGPGARYAITKPDVNHVYV
jgi:mannose-6-phosphate isomerase-like protein (cupin superfamily)